MSRAMLNRPSLAACLCLLATALACVLPALSGCRSAYQPVTRDQPSPGTAGPQPGDGAPRDPGDGVQAPHDESLNPPGWLPGHDEELWIIQTPDATPGAPTRVSPAHDAISGAGALLARPDPSAPSEELVPCSLKQTDVKASIVGNISTVDLAQQFENPLHRKMDAIYRFRLPDNAAVTEFVMTLGERHIRGIIRERREAVRIYDAARSQGYVASLLTQEGSNVFSQSIANIEPTKRIDIHIRYFCTLPYRDGWYEFTFPMATDRQSDGSAGNDRPRPAEQPGAAVSLTVSLKAKMSVGQIQSASHRISVQFENDKPMESLPNDPAIPRAMTLGTKSADKRWTIRLAEGEKIANRDFVLRWGVADAKAKSACIVSREERAGYFSLILVPPMSVDDLPRRPMELIWALDTSRAMAGVPLDQCRAAIRAGLARLGPQDVFQVIRFDTAADCLAPRFLPATPENIRAASDFLDAPRTGGVAPTLDVIGQCLAEPHNPDRLRCAGLFSNGHFGNEGELVRAISHRLGDARVFCFGVGDSPDRILLNGIARAGKGVAAYITPQVKNDVVSSVLVDCFDRMTHPALSDVQIDWGAMRPSEVYPSQLPDLIVGRPIVMTGKFTGSGSATLKVTGRAEGQLRSFDVPVDLDHAVAEPCALPAVWARAKIGELVRAAAQTSGRDLAGQVKEVAMEYGLAGPYTGFIAVDTMARTADEANPPSGNTLIPNSGERHGATVSEVKAPPNKAAIEPR